MLYISKTIFKITALIIIINSLISFNVTAEPVKNLNEKAADIKKKMEKGREEVKTFTQKELDIIASLNEVDLSLNEAKKKASLYEAELNSLEKKIKSAQSEYNSLAMQLKTSEIYAARRISGLYKLNHLGRQHVLVSAESIMDFFQRKKALESILDYDDELLKKLEKQKAGFKELTDNLNAAKKERLSLEKEYRKQINLLNHQRKQREKLLADIREKKSLAKAVLSSLKKDEEELDKKIKAFQARKSEYEKDPSESFKSFKGLLKMPVKGKIVSSFGPYKDTELNVMNFQSGINIEAEKGSPVYAVRSGQVIYSSWFKGYGNMIIIDHGDHYYTLYAHAEELFKTNGDIVQAGEVIATVGDSGSMSGPGLHFEVRHHGKPVDPEKWLKKG